MNERRVIGQEEVDLRRIFRGAEGVEIREMRSYRISIHGYHVATYYPDRRYVEFEEDLRDPTNLDPSLRPLISYIEEQNLGTNLK